MRRAMAVVVASAALLGSGCGQLDDVVELDLMVEATSVVPLRLVHDDVTAERSIRTVALVEDGFRDVVRILVDGKPVVDRVRIDDDVAMRVLDPDHATVEDEPTELAGVTVADAFAAARYVLDVGGAPPEVRAGSAPDAVARQLDVLAHLRSAMADAAEVVEWRPEQSNPATPVAEDRFPLPQDGERRFDLRQPVLPSIVLRQGQPTVADTQHVRKLAVFTRDGFVVRIVEHVEVLGASADDLEAYLAAYVRERGDEDVAAGLAELRDLDAAVRSATLLQVLSHLREEAGLSPVVQRERTVELLDHEAPGLVVELPEDPIEGRLAGVTIELPA